MVRKNLSGRFHPRSVACRWVKAITSGHDQAVAILGTAGGSRSDIVMWRCASRPDGCILCRMKDDDLGTGAASRSATRIGARLPSLRAAGNLLRLGLFLAVAVLVRAGETFDASHQAFARVLSARVSQGKVDYAGLKAAPEALDSYLAALSAVPEAEFKTWTESARLAFLLNLYNATTLKLIADRYPIASIKKAGGLFKGPWSLPVVHVWGRVLTLGDLEHQVIRVQHKDARIHFALVCAAVSCPPLRGEPYVAEKLAAQLDDQGRTFLRQPAKNRVDPSAGVLWLSPIFKWYAADFTADGKTIPEFVAPFFAEADAARIRAGGLKVKFSDYDWALNDR